MGNKINVCYRKFYTFDKYETPCSRCLFKCKYPPPGKPLPIKIIKEDGKYLKNIQY